MTEEQQNNGMPQNSSPDPKNASGLLDKRMRPEGVVPKQAQGYVVAGLAVLILMAVMFSKNRPKAVSKDPLFPASMVSSDINQKKIQELEQDLTAEQRQSQQQTPGQKIVVRRTETATSDTATNSAPGVATPISQPTEASRDPVADAERALVFKARFASNLVVSADYVSRPPTESGDHTESPPPGALRQAEQTGSTTKAVQGAKRAVEVNVNSAHGQPYVVFEGTTIDTALVYRLDGEFSGPVKVLVTDSVYSQDRQHVLIPEGTFILGDTQKVTGFGQKRLAITFHRLLMPDGYSVDLNQFHGLDQVGNTGLKDKVNNHYLQVFGASIALGLIAGAAEATTNTGYSENGSQTYRQGIASSLASSGTNVLDKFINIPPTITIREGQRLKVYLTQDMLLPAYENHDMPGVM